MYSSPFHYGVIVIGAGHAGCEAALAASRMGVKTLLLTMSLETIAQMSCNPAIGGLAKGHIVREIDALGGEMAKNTDTTSIQFRMLNMSKGPAVWAPRAQCDKKLYQLTMKHTLEQEPLLDIKQELVEEIIVKEKKVAGVMTATKMLYTAEAVIVTTGTFLKGLIHIGMTSFVGGRASEGAAEKLSANLRALGFTILRLKTGTPARLNRRSLDYSQFIEQAVEPRGQFSFTPLASSLPQVPCYIAYTNPCTHDIIRENLDRSPLYCGKIQGVGPRYCPSIEDKVMRFKEKDRHQIFIEPEGLETEEVYLNGLSTSLPQDVQIQMLQSIKGFERAQIMRFGYAVEYDCADPSQLYPTLETKVIQSLYFAGQINGTSGYEEAAAQGLMAGINAVLKIRNQAPFILDRSDAYIGVLIDDLITKGTQEPYRMFTSRAEYRLLLRQDNADIRLAHYGYTVGLLSQERYTQAKQKEEHIQSLILALEKTLYQGMPLAKYIKRPEVSIKELIHKGLITAPDDIALAAEIELKYEGYIRREHSRAEHLKKMEHRFIPEDMDYTKIKSMRAETREKLQKIRPCSIGQALRIPGVFVPDITLLLIYLKRE